MSTPAPDMLTLLVLAAQAPAGSCVGLHYPVGTQGTTGEEMRHDGHGDWRCICVACALNEPSARLRIAYDLSVHGIHIELFEPGEPTPTGGWWEAVCMYCRKVRPTTTQESP